MVHLQVEQPKVLEQPLTNGEQREQPQLLPVTVEHVQRIAQPHRGVLIRWLVVAVLPLVLLPLTALLRHGFRGPQTRFYFTWVKNSEGVQLLP